MTRRDQRIFDTADRVAIALQRAVASHDRPNSFSCGELATLYGGPSASASGRMGRHYLANVVVALGERGVTAEITYVARRWYVARWQARR